MQHGHYNILTLRWKTDGINGYYELFKNLPEISSRLASAVDDLVRAKYDSDKITLVGFSFGANIVGIAAEQTLEKIHEVVGKHEFYSFKKKKNKVVLIFFFLQEIDPVGITQNNIAEFRKLSAKSAKRADIVLTCTPNEPNDTHRAIESFVKDKKLHFSCPSVELAVGSCSLESSYEYWYFTVKKSRSVKVFPCSVYKNVYDDDECVPKYNLDFGGPVKNRFKRV